MIRLRRDSQFADKLRAYKIILDGLQIGQIRDGQAQEFDVSPGNHILSLKIDWCSSNEVEFVAGEEDVSFACGNPAKGPSVYLTGLAIFNKSGYLWLLRLTT